MQELVKANAISWSSQMQFRTMPLGIGEDGRRLSPATGYPLATKRIALPEGHAFILSNAYGVFLNK
jgi:hypothetical protein